MTNGLQWTPALRRRVLAPAEEWVEVGEAAWAEVGEWVRAGEWAATKVAAAVEGEGDIMPWVNKENCTGCGICVGICPVDAIVLDDCSAVIDMRGCIRCGQCHDACPENAVRHDSERIPIEVAGNVKRAREIMASCREHLGKGQEQNCLERTIRHFRKERKVIDATLDELTNLLEMQGTQ